MTWMRSCFMRADGGARIGWLAVAASLGMLHCVGDTPGATSGPGADGGGDDAAQAAVDGAAPDSAATDGGGDAGPPIPTGAFRSLQHFMTGSAMSFGSIASVVAAPGGGWIIGGIFNRAVTIGSPLTPAASGSYDAFVAKLDAAGTAVWARAFTGTDLESLDSLAVDDGGDVYAVGLTRSGALSYATDGSLTNPKPGYSMAYFVKLGASDGKSLWAQTIRATSGQVNRASVAARSGNRMALALTFGTNQTNLVYQGTNGVKQSAAPPVGVNDIVWVASVSTNDGLVQWENMLESTSGAVENSGDLVSGVALDSKGNIVIGGSFSGDPLRDSTKPNLASRTGSNHNAFVANLSLADGHVLWVKSYGDATGKAARTTTIATDAAGHLVAAGVFGGAVDFGAGVRTATSGSTTQDAWIVALDENSGATLWDKAFGNDGAEEVRGVAVDPWGSVVASVSAQGGTTASSVDGKPLPSEGGMYTVKLDPTGKAVWLNPIAKAGVGRVAASRTGDIAVTGTFDGTLNFGGGDVTSSGPEFYVLGYQP